MTAATMTSAADNRSQTQTPASGRWLNVLAHLDPKFGGMSSAVPALGAAVSGQRNHKVSIAGFCEPEEKYAAAAAGLEIHKLPAGLSNWISNPAFRNQFTKLVSASSGVHIHGLWEQSTLVAASAARRFSKPYIISAHGMLQPWALNNKRWKKAIYGALLERNNLRHAACLHALTEAEAADYRAYGCTNPIAVIPNGVEIPSNPQPGFFLERFPDLRGKRIVLFLSRIHFKKGLDILCKAWSSVAQNWPEAQLVLAGPDFENTRSSIEALVANAGIANRVTFTGMLNADLKWSALSAADCFVLPSYSEGLSVSVLEALGMGRPVIVSRQCNLPEVAAHGCGWVIEPNVSELEAALNDCLGASASSIVEMRLNGRTLVQQKYTWRAIGQQMDQVYGWVQGGPLPYSVEIKFGGARP